MFSSWLSLSIFGSPDSSSSFEMLTVLSMNETSSNSCIEAVLAVRLDLPPYPASFFSKATYRSLINASFCLISALRYASRPLRVFSSWLTLSSLSYTIALYLTSLDRSTSISSCIRYISYFSSKFSAFSRRILKSLPAFPSLSSPSRLVVLHFLLPLSWRGRYPKPPLFSVGDLGMRLLGRITDQLWRVCSMFSSRSTERIRVRSRVRETLSLWLFLLVLWGSWMVERVRSSQLEWLRRESPSGGVTEVVFSRVERGRALPSWGEVNSMAVITIQIANLPNKSQAYYAY